MGRSHPSFTQEQICEINEELKNVENKNAYKRIMVLKLKAVNKMRSRDIAQIVEMHEVTVNNIVGKYKKYGINSIVANNYKANRRYLPQEQEEVLLKQVAEQAENAKNLDIDQVMEAFENMLGHPIGKSTAYKILRRNNWDKITIKTERQKQTTANA